VLKNKIILLNPNLIKIQIRTNLPKNKALRIIHIQLTIQRNQNVLCLQKGI